jgi:Beta-glucosidase/6-phospho-beta-glucosidase/beta-galactosidase
MYQAAHYELVASALAVKAAQRDKSLAAGGLHDCHVPDLSVLLCPEWI